MTFILAVQLKDRIVVAADHRAVQIKKDSTSHFLQTRKLIQWTRGVMVGSGEHRVVINSMDLFLHVAQGNITKLPQCLQLAKLMRGLEHQHPQVQATQLLCSCMTEYGPQLYSVSTDEQGIDQLTVLQNNQLLLWMFNPDISPIIDRVQVLYTSLQAYMGGVTWQQWMDDCRQQFAAIYQIQARHDPMMSSSFDIFFQTQIESVYEHVPNIRSAVANF